MRGGGEDSLPDRTHAHELCVDAVRKVIGVVTLDSFTTPIVLSVIPPYRATGEALGAF